MAMTGNEKFTIRHETLIVCEGEDAYHFLIPYLNAKERLEEDARFGTSVDVISFGGNDELEKSLATVRLTPGFSNVKNMMILRDAEKSAEKASNDVRRALQKTGFSVPDACGKWTTDSDIHVAFMLFPTLSAEPEEGTLEHLCMKLLKPEYQPAIVLDSISDTMQALEEKEIRTFSHDFKSKLHGFFSLTDGFVGLKIGEAAKAGAFDWGSSELVGLNQCLRNRFVLLDER